jgi:hydrogenase maturation protein HypF
VSQHIGDLENLETLDHFRSALETYRRLFRIEPEVAVRDAHPGYLSTAFARELDLGRTITVQHHHAHVAAVLAEHGVRGPAIGVAFDGTGAGDDGTVWGAEFLIADLAGYRRAAHLMPAPLPGGDLAARMPWRAALGYLSIEPGFGEAFRSAFEGVDEAELRVARAQIRSGLNAPLASSMGRLFDAAAAILGVRQRSSYEGQAAMELEDLAGSRKGTAYPMPIEESGGRLVLDPLPLLSGLGSRLRGGAAPADLAADFHASVAWATARMVSRLAEQTGLRTAVLAGGCFQNARLLAAVTERLETLRIEVLRPVRLPPNDGAVSFGQAAAAAAILAAEKGG